VATLRVQSTGINVSPHLLAAVPYLVVLLILIVSHIMQRRDTGMPADLKSVFA
jgi:ABC-type uncharacterized transport system permease subunit